MFRFTIRDVLWAMVVVGLGVGWFAHWRSWESNRSPEFVRRELNELEREVTRQRETIRKLLGLTDDAPLPETLDQDK
jgi:hypothetical protein